MDNKTERITQLYNEYVDMIYRICFVFMKNEADTEDAVQAVFMKIIEDDRVFDSKSHEKAWIIVVAQNYCKNQLKHWWRKNVEFDPQQHDSIHKEEGRDILELVLKLPEKFKMPIYLHYYEGYQTDEIAQMLEINPSTLRSRLKKGRELLKLTIGGSSDE